MVFCLKFFWGVTFIKNRTRPKAMNFDDFKPTMKIYRLKALCVLITMVQVPASILSKLLPI